LDEGRDSEYDQYPIEELRALGWSKNYYNYTKYIPAMTLSGFFSLSTENVKLVRASDTLTWEDDLSLHRGNHSFMIGFRAMRAYQNDGAIVVRSMGTYQFNGTFSGSALTDFMLGRPSFFEQQNEQGATVAATSLAWYAQDNIRVSPRLTVNLGLRYELPLAPVETRGLVTVFRPWSTQRSQRFKNAPPGLFFLGIRV